MHQRYLLSVRGVIVADERVLMVCHAHRDRAPFWCYPGGHAEAGETVAGALRREVHEETGLEVVPGPVVYVQDFWQEGLLDLFLRAHVLGGQLALGHDPEPDADHLAQLAWIPLAELPSLDHRPRRLGQLLAACSGRMDRLPPPAVHDIVRDSQPGPTSGE